jgi:hypothetical protein
MTQSSLNRFLTGFSEWDIFNRKRMARLQEDPDTARVDEEVFELDDTHAPYTYAKGIPFLQWPTTVQVRFYTWAMNIVALHATRSNGLE